VTVPSGPAVASGRWPPDQPDRGGRRPGARPGRTHLVPVKVNAKSGLTEEQLVYLRAKLMQANREIVSRARSRRPGGEGDPLEQGAGADPVDKAEQSSEQALAVELGELDRRRLNEINDALRRMEEGTYGICEGTGDPIGLPRLSVEPWARYTSAYQELLEQQAGGGRPPSL
jgi:DnaK suppressor protein